MEDHIINEVIADDSPKISLRHFLGGMLATALALALLRPKFGIAATKDSSSQNLDFLNSLSGVLSSMTFGMLCVSLAMLFARRLQSRNCFQHPGHWLLGIDGSAYILSFVVQANLLRSESALGSNDSLYNFFLFSVIATVSVKLIGYGIWPVKLTITLAWIPLWVALVLTTIFEVIRIVSHSWSNFDLPGDTMQQELITEALLAVTLLISVLGDRRWLERDWLHFAGLMAIGLGVLQRTAWTLAIHIFELM